MEKKASSKWNLAHTHTHWLGNSGRNTYSKTRRQWRTQKKSREKNSTDCETLRNYLTWRWYIPAIFEHFSFTERFFHNFSSIYLFTFLFLRLHRRLDACTAIFLLSFHRGAAAHMHSTHKDKLIHITLVYIRWQRMCIAGRIPLIRHLPAQAKEIFGKRAIRTGCYLVKDLFFFFKKSCSKKRRTVSIESSWHWRVTSRGHGCERVKRIQRFDFIPSFHCVASEPRIFFDKVNRFIVHWHQNVLVMSLHSQMCFFLWIVGNAMKFDTCTACQNKIRISSCPAQSFVSLLVFTRIKELNYVTHSIGEPGVICNTHATNKLLVALKSNDEYPHGYSHGFPL